MKKIDPIWDKLTFSGLQRQVMVFHCVGESNAFLSGGDRMQCVWNLLEMKKKHTPQEIEAYCQEYADNNLQHNMAVATTLRDRGL